MGKNKKKRVIHGLSILTSALFCSLGITNISYGTTSRSTDTQTRNTAETLAQITDDSPLASKPGEPLEIVFPTLFPKKVSNLLPEKGTIGLHIEPDGRTSRFAVRITIPTLHPLMSNVGRWYGQDGRGGMTPMSVYAGTPSELRDALTPANKRAYDALNRLVSILGPDEAATIVSILVTNSQDITPEDYLSTLDSSLSTNTDTAREILYLPTQLNVAVGGSYNLDHSSEIMEAISPLLPMKTNDDMLEALKQHRLYRGFAHNSVAGKLSVYPHEYARGTKITRRGSNERHFAAHEHYELRQ